MVHTLDISTPLTPFEYAELQRELGANPQKAAWSTNDYSASGLTQITLYRIVRPNYTGHFIRIAMNPYHVMKQSADPMALFDPADFAALIPAFDFLITTITNIILPSLPNWIACRIDYAVDAVVGNSATRPAADRYIELARRGYLPFGATNQSQVDWISFRAGNSSCGVQLYHRGPALRSRFMGLAETIYLQADTLLRLEVQCKKGRLASLAHKHHFPGRALHYFMHTPDIDRYELSRQCRRIFGGYDFVSYRRAAATINRDSQLRRRTKEDIQYFIKAIEIEGGIMPAQEKWQHGMSSSLHFAKRRINVRFSPAQIRRLVRRLSSFGFHFVTIPASWHIGVIEHPFPCLIV